MNSNKPVDLNHPVNSKQPLWVMLLLSVFAWAPATHPGYWRALEGFLPAFNLTTLQRIAAIGVAPDLWRGEGIGTFMLPHLLFRAGLAPVVALRMTFILAIMLGGVGIYLWLERHFSSRGAALGGLTYMLLPTVLATVYIRGRLADVIVLALLPWLFFALTALAHSPTQKGRSVHFVFAVLLLGWLWLSQAGLALLASLLLLAYALFVLRNRILVASVLVGAAVGAATLLPISSLSSPAKINFTEHFVYFFQLLRNHWQVAPSISGWQDGYPFQPGLSVVTISFLVIWLWATTNPQPSVENRRFLQFGSIGSALLIALCLGLSAPFWQLTGAERLLNYPWQILILAAPLLVILPAALPSLAPAFGEVPLWSALLLLTLANSYPNLTTDYTATEPPVQPLAIIGDNQLALLSAQLDESHPPTVTLTIGWQVLQPLVFDYNIFLQALSDESPQAHVVAQFDGQPLLDHPATTWSYGEIFTATYTLQMPAQESSAPRYIFGMYDWRDGTRLPVDGGKDDKFAIHGKKE